MLHARAACTFLDSSTWTVLKLDSEHEDASMAVIPLAVSTAGRGVSSETLAFLTA